MPFVFLDRGLQEKQMILGLEMLSSFLGQAANIVNRAIDIEQQRYTDAEAKDRREHEFHLAALKSVLEARR